MNHRQISVLVVEDVDEMRHLLKHLLDGIPGISATRMAKNGFEARLEVSRRRPDLILLDEILPGESGHDLLQEFASTQIPILLMTSVENPTHALGAGARARIVKPGWKSVQEDRDRLKKVIFDHLK
jgi:two-component system response regulator CitB